MSTSQENTIHFFLCSANIKLDIMSSKSKMNLVRIIPIDQKHFPHKPSLQEIQIFLTWRSRDIIAKRTDYGIGDQFANSTISVYGPFVM